jgi:predicted nucleic acid-binding protein
LIVVDTNILAYFWLPSERSLSADALLRKDPEWYAPFLWRSEFLNVLAIHLRQKRISPSDARRAVERASNQMFGRERLVSMDAILSLVDRSTCSAYDCEFVALALDLGLPLITEDRRILGQFPAVAQDMASFIARATER